MTKFASSNRFGGDCIKRIANEGLTLHNHSVAIGHTRWATHGDKTDVNAHPHYDHKKRLALIHNGIISNYFELKQMLKNELGIIPVSQTDTEIVAILIGTYLDKGLNLFESIEQAALVLEGAYSFVLISILEPENLYIFKNTGTMVIGVSDGLKAPNDLQHLADDPYSNPPELVPKKSSNHEF